MRSGYHILFDAQLATSRVRAERDEAMRRMARAMEPMRAMFVRVGVDARSAMASIAAAGKALDRAGLTAAAVHKQRRRLP